MIPCTKILKGERSAHNETKGGPLVIWNITARCNLRCAHCYRDSSASFQARELSDEKCIEMVRQIKALDPPIALLTGGEPLLRGNFFGIVRECKAVRLRVGLSTNGTLIGREQADKIGQSGVDYVGISIDGKRRAHDEFRGLTGAFDMSWNAISLLNRIGVKTGVRFTLTGDNCSDLLDILEMTSRAGTKRFCLYHLVYAGRAGKEQDLALKDKKRYMESFFNKVKELALLDPAFEALTTDNPVDGLFLSRFAGDSEAALSCISSSGGCSAGERIVYLDSNGDVFPCQFLRDLPLGNVLERPLIDIWEDAGNVYLRQLRSKKDFVTGRCALCSHKEICAGCRARAKACYGSLWAEDPACYLEASEINNVALSYRS